METLVHSPEVLSQIFFIRGKKVILDFHLASLYEVETRVLKQQVKRNLERFPEDFMFQLTEAEVRQLVSQFVIPSKSVLGGVLPHAFTEQGVAMLSGILRSKKAIAVNISIMLAFVKMRELLDSSKELHDKLGQLEAKYDQQFKVVFDALRQLIDKKNEPRERIGFRQSIND